MRLKNTFSKFNSSLSGGVVALYSNRMIQEIADGLLGLFFPVFLFEKYQSINKVLLFYLFSYLLILFLSAPGAMIASRIGFKKALIFSVAGGVGYYICFYFFDYNIILFSILALIFINYDRMLYWTPYHSDFAKLTDKKTRGRVIGLLNSVGSLVGIAVPILAGFIIAQSGFRALFLIVIVVYASSVIPFFVLPEISEQFTFGIRQTWKILFHPRDRRILFTYMADGAENVIAGVVWPIFLFQILRGDYRAVGVVSSLIILATIFIRLILGNYVDKFSKKKLLKYGTIFYSFGWLVKMFVQTGFQVFAISTYHNFSSIAMRTPYNALMYEKAADAGHYVDEYTVLRDMSLSLGRITAILLLMILFSFASLNSAFILAAVVILFINLL